METIAACEFKSLSIEDKGLFDFYYSKMNDNWVSTISFASMIAWNKSIRIYHRIIGEYLCILANDTTCDQWYTIPLIGHYDQKQLEKSIRELIDIMEELGRPVQFVSISEWMLPYYLHLRCMKLKEVYDISLSDYIYDVKDFMKSMNNQSNRYDYNYFIRRFNPKLVLMRSMNSDYYIDLIQKCFCMNHECRICVYGCQQDTIRNVTERMSETGAMGIAVYIEEELVGYAIVSIEKTQLIYHFKENLHGYRGLGIYLNKKCFELFGENVELINYTEDIGIEGLRKYKKQLSKYRLSHKYELLRILSNKRCIGIMGGTDDKK